MIKLAKLFLILLLPLVLLFFPLKIAAQINKVNIHVFTLKGCPHCADEKEFLKKLQSKYEFLAVREYELSENKSNRDLMIAVGNKLNADVSGVPFTVVGEIYIAGFGSEETTGREIEAALLEAKEKNSPDLVSEILKRKVPEEKPLEKSGVTAEIPKEVKIPFFGLVKVSDLSLPAFTFIVALADGFNPCAMWVLLFLISLLIGMHDKFKMIVLGSAFILASGLVYFLFLSAWLNLFLFLGFIFWVRTLIGGVALTAGGYNLKEFFTNKEGSCKVTGNEKRRKVFDKLKNLTASKNFLLSLGGIVLLAFAVNLVELICSAGLPAVYTKVLTLSALPAWKYYAYLLFYILIFMLDDLIIFLGAVFTFHLIGINTKYARFSHLIGGIAMLVVGILMIFAPQLLLFS